MVFCEEGLDIFVPTHGLATRGARCSGFLIAARRRACSDDQGSNPTAAQHSCKVQCRRIVFRSHVKWTSSIGSLLTAEQSHEHEVAIMESFRGSEKSTKCIVPPSAVVIKRQQETKKSKRRGISGSMARQTNAFAFTTRTEGKLLWSIVERPKKQY